MYFNGNEAMKMGLEKIATTVEEDYTKILPIYKESLPGTESLVKSDMDIAIEKGIKLIKIHSITKPPESNRKQTDPRKRKDVKPEYNKWVDNAYMMMGKAYLYQKDFIRASSTFTLIIRKYKNEPVKYESYLWLVRTYTESERFNEARELIESLDGNDQFPEKLEGELAINAAELHLKQQHYEEAIQYLNIGIKKIKGNKRKIRYTYILAQLYQEMGNMEKALKTYHQVIRRRPNYTMLFNAQINSASVFSGESDVSVLRKELNKMRKKKRNEPFLDQIYFALGNIIYNEGKIDDAVDYYKKSAAASITNTHQRALSCLTLADIYFDKKKYIPSGNYYDSAMVVIEKNYPNYKAIAEKHRSLSKLVNNLVMVETQDSLQLLAALSPEDLDAKIEKWIEIEKAKMVEMEEEGLSSEYDQAYGRASSSRMRVRGGSGGWYFYNPSTVSYGKKEFGRLWGARKNEDNWRRSDKSISLTDEFGEPLEEDLSELIEEEEVKINDRTTKEYYLQDIPNSDSLMAISHDKIRDALFNAGNIFKTEFNDYERSIECFNELNQRYPQNVYELPSYFSLWDLYETVELDDSSNYFKNEILDNFPNSNYAKYLINPNYFIEEEARKDSLNSLYNLAFNAYKNRNFKQSLNYIKQVEKMEPDTALVPKIDFIKLVSSSRGMNQKQFAKRLEEYIKKYPTSEPAILAQQISELVAEEKLSNYDEMINTGYLSEVIKNLELLPQNETSEDPFAGKWDSDSELLHYFIIAVPNDETIDINRLKYDIANYNIDHYTSLDFDIETENLNNDTKLIVVRNFNEKESALIYFLSIIRKPQVFKTLAGQKFINFIISNNNFREMLSDRNYTDYLQFFVKNYSSYTSDEFLDQELETPEELMAKLKQDDNDYTEQGEFVMIDTDDGSYVAPEPKEQVYKLDYDEAHSYVIFINEPRFRTGFLMRDFVRYNSANHRSERLRVIPYNLKEATLLLISSFDNAFSATQYFKEVTANNDLYKSLKETKYISYVVSPSNLTKLKETNNIEEWKEFYNYNYVYRKPPAPVVEEIEEAITSSQQTEEIKKVEEEIKDKTNTEDKDVEADEEKTDSVESAELPVKDTLAIPTTRETTNEVESENVEPDVDFGPYVYSAEAMHNLVYLLPSSGSNKALLTTYVSRFNAMKYRSYGLQIKSEEFDEFRSIVIISGIGNKEKAIEYFNAVSTDNRVTMSVRNVNYKSYLISIENLATFMKEKNIAEYQKFHDANY